MYANTGWKQDHGGKLRLWLSSKVACAKENAPNLETSDSENSEREEDSVSVENGSSAVLDVEPVAGRLVIFLSGAIDHAVLPSFAERTALTCWFR